MDEYDREMEAQRNQLDATFQLRLKVYAAKSVFVLLGAEIEPGRLYWGPDQLLYPLKSSGWRDDSTYGTVTTGRVVSGWPNMQQLPKFTTTPKQHQQFKTKARR